MKCTEACPSEEVADGELEDAAFFEGEGLEGEAPFEAQGAERREPADAHAVRSAELDEAGRAVEARIGDAERRTLRGVAVDLLEVPGVAGVGEDVAAYAD